MKVPTVTKRLLVPLTALTLSTAAYSSNIKDEPKDFFKKEVVEKKNNIKKGLIAPLLIAVYALAALGYKAAIKQNVEDNYNI